MKMGYAQAVTNVGTMSYDTIYAAQDVKDDLKLGIGSPVVRHRENTRILLSAAALTQLTLLCGTGVAMKAGLIFFIGSCVGTAVTLTTMISKVNLSDPKDCTWWFRKGSLLTGAAIGSGFLIEFCSINHNHSSQLYVLQQQSRPSPLSSTLNVNF